MSTLLGGAAALLGRAGMHQSKGPSAPVERALMGHMGGLYRRLLACLLVPDTEAQAARLGRGRADVRMHPWYPVLVIGMDKVRLYMQAVDSDLAGCTRILGDAGWLVRVGLYLELLTCMGIAQAAAADYPHLLSAAELHLWQHEPALATVRAHVDVAAWRAAWATRAMGPRPAWLPARLSWIDGLVRKERAGTAFVEAHHQDLRAAMLLAGPVPGHAGQAIWLRVCADAETAVLRQAYAVLPELMQLPGLARHWLLWHERGHLAGSLHMPRRVSCLVSDRDGVFLSASRAYRASMNQVASWAQARGLMDFAGKECIPAYASRIEELARKRRYSWEALVL